MLNNKFVPTLFLVIFVFIVQGCGSFPKQKIAHIGDMSTLVKKHESKPTVFLDYKRTGGLRKNPQEIVVSQIESEFVYNIVKSSGLFSTIIFDEYKKNKADFTLEINTCEYIGSPYLVAPKILISGFSFTLIPSVWDFIFITNTRIIDKQGTTIAEYKNEDGVTWWIWLFVLPFGDKGFDMNRYDILSNLIKDSLIHISKNNEYEKLIDRKL